MTRDAYGRGVSTDSMPRCWRCGRLLAELVSRPWRIRCGRCKADNRIGVDEQGQSATSDQ